jgi:glycosyltransferase involved in cell wall biosynthesis
LRNIETTVLLASHNGEAVLARTLEGYCSVNPEANSWKLVIVDNGSTDSTPHIIEAFKARLPLERVHEPVAGKNRALNAGLARVEGSVVILTDDDAIPHPDFLKAWSKVFRAKPEYELFGGSIEPIFDTPPPEWLVKDVSCFDILFATRNAPEGPIDAAAIYGPNMAVRTSVFNRGFRFNENIGPNGMNPDYPMGSETEFCRRLESSGISAWNASEPLVQHIIRAHQVNEAYWIKRAYRHGRGVARQRWEAASHAIPDRVARPYVIRQLARLRNQLRMLSPSPAQRLSGKFGYHSSRGMEDEIAHILANGGRRAS